MRSILGMNRVTFAAWALATIIGGLTQAWWVTAFAIGVGCGSILERHGR